MIFFVAPDDFRVVLEHYRLRKAFHEFPPPNQFLNCKSIEPNCIVSQYLRTLCANDVSQNFADGVPDLLITSRQEADRSSEIVGDFRAKAEFRPPTQNEIYSRDEACRITGQK